MKSCKIKTAIKLEETHQASDLASSYHLFPGPAHPTSYGGLVRDLFVFEAGSRATTQHTSLLSELNPWSALN